GTVTITSVTPAPEGSASGISGTESGANMPWSFTIAWGDGTPNYVHSAFGNNWGATHIYAETGNYTINVTVTDGGNSGSASTVISITADAALSSTTPPTFTYSNLTPESPPSLTNPGNQAKAEGNNVSLQVSASDSDADT